MMTLKKEIENLLRDKGFSHEVRDIFMYAESIEEGLQILENDINERREAIMLIESQIKQQ